MAARKKKKRKKAGRPKGRRNPKTRAGKKAKPMGKVRVLKIKSGLDPFKVQNALRKDKYFARAVSLDKVATNAPGPKSIG